MRMFLINSCCQQRVPGSHQLGHEAWAHAHNVSSEQETQKWRNVEAKVGQKLMSLGNGLEVRSSKPLAKRDAESGSQVYRSGKIFSKIVQICSEVLFVSDAFIRDKSSQVGSDWSLAEGAV